VKKQRHDADRWIKQSELLWSLLSSFLQIWLRTSVPTWVLELVLDMAAELARRTATAFAAPGKDEEMKKLMVVLVLCLAASVPSVAAEHVVAHSAKVVSKDSYKAAKYSVKKTGKFLKFVF
jgi:hypothetical protein